MFVFVSRTVRVITCCCSGFSDIINRYDHNISTTAVTVCWHQSNVTVVVTRLAVDETWRWRPCDTPCSETCSAVNSFDVYVFLSPFSKLLAKWCWKNSCTNSNELTVKLHGFLEHFCQSCAYIGHFVTYVNRFMLLFVFIRITLSVL